MYISAIAGALCIISSFVIFQGALEYTKILKEFSTIDKDKKMEFRYIPRLNLVLMILFFFGYISIGIIIGYSIKLNTELIITSIFILSGVFVYSVIYIQRKMLEYIEDSNIQAISALVNAIEARDEYTKGHSQHVSSIIEVYFYSLSDKEKEKLNIKKLKIAGLLHDIGKIGVKEFVLNKPGRLNDEEYYLMKKHPEIGRNILSSVSSLKEISEWIYYHHERVDGKGYYNIEEEKIPLESRIISVADTYSALVTDRVYRKGKTHEEAVEILLQLKGTQLDENVVNNFVKIKKDKLVQCKKRAFV